MNQNRIAARYQHNVQKAYEYARDQREYYSQQYKENGDPMDAEERERMHDIRDAL